MDSEQSNLKDVGQRIFEIRKKSGLNQKEFAALLNISTGTISELEAGNGKPSFEVLSNLSLKHNIDLHWLFHGTGDMYKKNINEIINESFVPGERIPLLDKFIRYFRGSELVRFYMLASFREILMKNEAMIERELKNKNAGKGADKHDTKK